MHQSINGCCCGHSIFKNLISFRKNKIAGNECTSLLVTLRQKKKENIHFFPFVRKCQQDDVKALLSIKYAIRIFAMTNMTGGSFQRKLLESRLIRKWSRVVRRKGAVGSTLQ